MDAILNMVKEILAYFNEIDAANVVEIIRNGLNDLIANIPQLL